MEIEIKPGEPFWADVEHTNDSVVVSIEPAPMGAPMGTDDDE